MNTKQQIDNLKIGDTIIVYRKQRSQFRETGARNFKNGSDEWTITGFTKTQIRANRYYENANVALDSFTTSWHLKYPEIEVPPALWSCVACKTKYPYTKQIYGSGKCCDCY